MSDSIVEAIESGDRLSELKALHLRIARAVDDEATPARDLASLSRRQMEISREIEALEKQAEEALEHGAISEDEEFDPSAI